MEAYKRITEVREGQITNETKVLAVDTDGVKQIPPDALGAVKTVNGTQPDEYGNIEIPGLPDGASPCQQLVTDANGVATWINGGYVKQKVTFPTPVWNKSSTVSGTACVAGPQSQSMLNGLLGRYIKVSEHVPAMEDFFADSVTVDVVESWDVKETFDGAYSRGVYVSNLLEVPYVIVIPGVFKLPAGDYNGTETWYDFWEPGVYVFMKSSDKTDVSFECPCYIPMSEVAIPHVQTAQPGQTIVVKSVDENGKPVEWEAVRRDDARKVPIVDMTAIIPNKLQCSYPDYAELFQRIGSDPLSFYEIERICLEPDGDEIDIRATRYEWLLGNRMRIYFGDDLCPIIMDATDHTLILDPDWEKPAASIKTINGKASDENGSIEIGKTVTVVFMDLMGDLTTSHSASEIMDLMLNSGEEDVVRFAFGVRDFDKPMGPDPQYCHTRIDTESYYDGTSYLKLKFKIFFGDEVAPVIVDCIEETITTDPDWVAPIESVPAPATAEVGQVMAVKAVDENGKPTEWEAMDITGTGGGVTEERVNELIAEALANIPNAEEASF